ncbi:MAG: response regulator transcription factor [Bacteroidales bacterium]|jgi:DNA-binding response OmpR family regulator|nr:response regulator transcription factor [Bacteroidales bacterium]
MSKIKVLYVEDEEALAMIVVESLEVRDFDVIYCSSANEALLKLKSEKPDICVLDVMMPGMNGFELAKEIRITNKALPIVFLTAKSQTRDVIEGFELGAHDYIKKPFSIEELIIRLKSIVKREGVVVETIPVQKEYNIGTYLFDYNRQILILSGTERKLTSREAEILLMLCENRNNVLERNTVLRKLWGDDSFFNARSMDVFITKLRKYLAKDPRIEIINVRGVGYKLIC